jgi:hypothetical protein
MSETLSSQQVASRPIRALMIQPDNTYEVREIEQDIRTWQRLVGGYIEAVTTDHCIFWCDEDGKYKEQPCNTLATYLWWKISPEMETQDVLQGTVLVTGLDDGDQGDSLPVPDEVLELFGCIEQINRETEEEES